MLYALIATFLASNAAGFASDRGEHMRKLSGGKLVCRTDLPEWYSFWLAYMQIDSSRDADHDQIGRIQEFLYVTISSNHTKVFECNVGVIAGYVRLAQMAESKNDKELAYRSLQMAMIFVYTLRSKQRIPLYQELMWKISTREMVDKIQKLKYSIHSESAQLNLFNDENKSKKNRIGIVSICAYPVDSELILREFTPKNRETYASLHDYEAITYLEHPIGKDSNICIQHSKLWIMLKLLKTGKYDWLMWLDCDSIIVNMKKSIETIIDRFVSLGTDLLISEEMLGLSSANWVIRNSEWSRKFLETAFDIAHNQIPLFGDQDAIISNAIGRGKLDPHITIVPQNEFNAYDALNAYFMGSPGYTPGDMLVTFPQCKDASCNALFREAFLASDDPEYFTSRDENHANVPRLRVFGPQSRIIELYNSHWKEDLSFLRYAKKQ